MKEAVVASHHPTVVDCEKSGDRPRAPAQGDLRPPIREAQTSCRHPQQCRRPVCTFGGQAVWWPLGELAIRRVWSFLLSATGACAQPRAQAFA